MRARTKRIMKAAKTSSSHACPFEATAASTRYPEGRYTSWMGDVGASLPIAVGEKLAGKYLIEKLVGRGAMGVVVAARHLDLDEQVAIKFLAGNIDATKMERFLREARAAAKMKNEHVCRVFDVGRLESGEPYIVMEY